MDAVTGQSPNIIQATSRMNKRTSSANTSGYEHISTLRNVKDDESRFALPTLNSAISGADHC